MTLATNIVQPPLRAVAMGLFPTLDSCQTVVDLGMSQLPLKDPNALLGLLMTYHNTLLAQFAREAKEKK